jgi:hypothetical protein
VHLSSLSRTALEVQEGWNLLFINSITISMGQWFDYLLDFTDSDAAKWNYNCNRNFQANSWIFPIAVLLLWPVPEETLLGSFHWWSNEEIPILTLMVRSLCSERDRSKEQQLKNHLFFLCELVCGLLSHWLDARGRHWLIL